MTRFALFRDAFSSHFWLREKAFRSASISTDVEISAFQARQQSYANESCWHLAQRLTAIESDATVNSGPRAVSGVA